MGVEAVATFFVLSGFLVGGMNLDRCIHGTFDLRRYAVDRVTRIYLVLIPLLLAVAALDLLGRATPGITAYYTDGNPLIVERFKSIAPPNLKTWFANIFALQEFYSPVFGTDIPLWSLSYEIWFYVLAGIGFTAVSARRSIGALLLAGAAAILLALGIKFVFFLALWAIGLGAYRLCRLGWACPPWLRWTTAAMLPASMLVSAQAHLSVHAGAAQIKPLLVPVALACGFLLVTWRSTHAPLLRRTRAINAYLASFSFTLYLIHFPVALIMIAGMVALIAPDPGGFSGFQPLLWQGALVFGSAVVAALCAAIAGASITEWRTATVRAWISRRIAGRA